MAKQSISDDRVRGLLLSAFVEGFIDEQGMKSSSRYPLVELSRREWIERLEPEFDQWLASTSLIVDDERERLSAASTTLVVAT